MSSPHLPRSETEFDAAAIGVSAQTFDPIVDDAWRVFRPFLNPFSTLNYQVLKMARWRSHFQPSLELEMHGCIVIGSTGTEQLPLPPSSGLAYHYGSSLCQRPWPRGLGPRTAIPDSFCSFLLQLPTQVATTHDHECLSVTPSFPDLQCKGSFLPLGSRLNR